MRRFLTIILLFLSVAAFAQEQPDSVCAVVMDAETGEPVPYVSIYVSPSCGTISNYDGEFSLECLPSDVLRITSIGYQRVSFQAMELPDTIRMKPVASTLREVTVMGTDDVLYRLVRKMQKEAGKHKKTESNYFFRLTTQYPGTDELAEAFLSAKSCVQLRNITFHSGNRGLLVEKGILDNPDLKGLGRTNLHVFLRLAPILVFYDYWDFALVPGDIVLNRKGKIYEASCTKFTEDDGTEIRKIRVEGKPGYWPSDPILEGTMYVDYKRCQLLRFDGQKRGLFLRMYDHGRQRLSIDTVSYDMHIDYRHDHGFTEIANMSGTIVRDKVMLRYLLCNLGDKEMTFKKSVHVGDNMLQTIDKVGYDSLLWATTSIVKRTQLEERIAFQDSTFFMPNRSKYNTPPTEQERAANKYLRDAIHQLKGNAMQLHRGLPQK
ncbi:MAG: hypothetical protein J6W03_00915 [Bacteroidaceae bacterium]|nr:hypothetical protein [Bacteroidaceae bacterium]